MKMSWTIHSSSMVVSNWAWFGCIILGRSNLIFVLALKQSDSGPPYYDWAKSFLQSNAQSHLTSGLSTSNGNATLFSLPNSCPQVDLHACSNLELTSSAVLEPLCEELGLDTEDSSFNFQATPKQTPKSRKKGKAPLSKADVRRSMRLKLIHKGFKSSPTSCKDKNCLGCSAKPPTISPKVIRNLGASFYGINPADLTNSKLNAKLVAKKKKKTVKSKEAGPSSNQGSQDQAASSSSHSSKNGVADPSSQLRQD